ncbi:isochorismatase [Acinetobacter colistiniresistens]|uniref:isochorismatase n=1 Tax=Acinetobacter colistiniresistens TaxID=280145 RepID=A0A558F7U5_9GAMM|nr:isochorismatase [Acinetobacter colistiniresistens]TVT81656.1 isochorismatase [Acinetobacter colistiniresistens]
MSIPKIASYAMPLADEFTENKTHWQLDAKQSVLLVHDMQQYFLDFYDQQQAPIPELLKNTQALIEQARQLNIPVVYTAQPGDQTAEHRQLLTDFWGTGLKADPQITRIHPVVAATETDTVLTKWRYSAFKFSEFEQLMQQWGRDQLVICGVYAHIGCLMSAAEAFMLNIKPFVCGDAMADFSRAEHDMALKYISTRCGQVMTTSQVLRLWALKEMVMPLSQEGIIAAVSEQLQIPVNEIELHDDLLMLGLDSVRLMTLVGKWQAHGANVSFEDLAEQPTLGVWIEKLVA